MFAVPEGKGKLEKIIKSSILLPFPKGRANWRKCPSGYLRYATAREHEKISFRKSSSWDKNDY